MLEDCGQDAIFYDEYDQQVKVRIQMVITAPKGEMRLFESPLHTKYGVGEDYDIVNTKCEAIKLFMEEHKEE